MLRNVDRFLTTHTGSLPRPPALTSLYARRVRGEPVDDNEIATVARDALALAVRRQVETGIDVVNNGEQERESFVLYLRRRLGGLGGQGERNRAADIDAYPLFREQQERLAATRVSVTNTEFLPKAVGEVRYLKPAMIEKECDDFAAALAAEGNRHRAAFLTAPSPGLLAAIVRNEYYDSFEAYLYAISEAVKIEYEAIVGRGFLLQIDAPDLAMERHISFRDRPLSDFLSFVEQVVEAINRALSNVPSERVRVHVCWGNYEGPHDHDIPLSDILPVISRLRVGGYVLPFANGRHAHEFRCLGMHAIGDDQVVVAGVIDTLSNVIEHPEVVADRIERVAEIVGAERIVAGTDCGFDTSAGNSRVAPDVAWAKLAALVEGARRATARLFGKRG